MSQEKYIGMDVHAATISLTRQAPASRQLLTDCGGMDHLAMLVKLGLQGPRVLIAVGPVAGAFGSE